jgi:hypothetical protein
MQSSVMETAISQTRACPRLEKSHRQIVAGGRSGIDEV